MAGRTKQRSADLECTSSLHKRRLVDETFGPHSGLQPCCTASAYPGMVAGAAVVSGTTPQNCIAFEPLRVHCLMSTTFAC